MANIQLRERFLGGGYVGTVQAEPALSWADRAALQSVARGAMASALELRALNWGQQTVISLLSHLEGSLGLRLDVQTRVLSTQTEYLARIDEALRTPAKTRAAERIADSGELLRRRRWDRALALAREAIEEDPNNPAGFRAAGWALLGLQQPEEAKHEFVECAAAADSDERAQALRQAARLELALTDADHALSLLDGLGDLGEFETAAVDYDRSIYLAQLGRTEEAKVALQRALDVDDRFAVLAIHDDLIADQPQLTTIAGARLEELSSQLSELRTKIDDLLEEAGRLLSEHETEAAAGDAALADATLGDLNTRLLLLHEQADSVTSRYDNRLLSAIAELRDETLPAASVLSGDVAAALAAAWERIQRRDALQARIEEAAAALGREQQALVRSSRINMFTLAGGEKIYPAVVHRQRRGLRPAKTWLVTLNRHHDGVEVRQIPNSP